MKRARTGNPARDRALKGIGRHRVRNGMNTGVSTHGSTHGKGTEGVMPSPMRRSLFAKGGTPPTRGLRRFSGEANAQASVP
jgi:hypothetical protein